MSIEHISFSSVPSHVRDFVRPHGTAKIVSWSLALTLGFALAASLYRTEGSFENATFAVSVTLALILALTLVSRRVLFSTALITSIVALVTIIASVKRYYVDMVLHAYDIVFYVGSPSTLRFLWVDHKTELIGLAAALAAIAAGGWCLWKWDPTRLSRKSAALLLVALYAAGSWAANAKGERKNLLFYFDHSYVSSFYSSFSETWETLLRGQLIEAGPASGQPPFAIPQVCTPERRPPHIILIHQESVVPPEFFPALRYDKTLDPFFRSDDGQLHRLRVETYGGASWLTEFSVLGGVSTYSFGGMRPFVQSLMRDKIHETLPQVLARCGYRNTMFYPVGKNFVSNGKFYEAAGITDIFDATAQKAKRFNERDSFYYGNALDEMARHFNASRKPLFTYIITSATHLPYQYTYEPQADVPGGGDGRDPEMNEYLRRVGMAKLDYAAFRNALKSRFPNEAFLIVQYGDHQPVVTRQFLGFDRRATAEDVKLEPASPGFVTYYAVEGINYTPRPLPEVETLDVPYLSTVLLDAARLPLPESYLERVRLMHLCGGRFQTCPYRDQVLGFNRRLIESGLIDAR